MDSSPLRLRLDRILPAVSTQPTPMRGLTTGHRHLEETARWLDNLDGADPRGDHRRAAQRRATDDDGPQESADALPLAARPETRGLGVAGRLCGATAWSRGPQKVRRLTCADGRARQLARSLGHFASSGQGATVTRSAVGKYARTRGETVDGVQGGDRGGGWRLRVRAARG